MPFTLSHPAAAAPFSRFGLVLSALVVGSMSPDFIYFFHMAPRGHWTHTIPGVLLFCLPGSLLVLCIYHRLLMEPIAALLPSPLQDAFMKGQPFRFWPAQRLALLCASVLIGALTHLIWDSFTHEGSLDRLFPFLGMRVIDMGFDEVPLTRILHHASTIIGAFWIMLRIRRWTIKAKGDSGAARLGKREVLKTSLALLTLLSAAATLGILYARGQQGMVGGYDDLRRMMLQGLVASGTFLIILLTGYGAVWHVMKEKVSSKQ